MNEVKVLIEGYAKETEVGWTSCSTVTLVKSNGKSIIVDPGFNRTQLLDSLKKENLKTKDIDYVFLTHNHPDHALLAGIFENAKVVDELYIYDNGIITEHGGLIPDTDLKIIRTPGHMEEHCSLVVPIQQETFVVAGDVFWWLENEKQEININKPDNDPEHMDIQKLIASRKKVLEIADYIIPGHGKIFKVNK
ncbi:MAG: MBL fold metallo-hydrolase [Candidatus Aenigmarchaeota archaeon]|nr:MBL fold metallo-hydrolase [Candidatus Aenigmarchaeota archaeon]